MTGSLLVPGTARALSLAFLLALAPATQGVACGRDTDCAIGERSYRIALPDSHEPGAPPGAILFIHGYRGTAEGVMQNQSLMALTSELDVALIAAQAAGPEWNIPNIPSVDARQGVDELAYFDALADDVARRFGIDRSRVLVAGFSSGAMMVWHLACYRGGSFAGFVAMSGTFWEPIPETCPTLPKGLIHYHGSDDPVVPLHGRRIKDAHQGDVLAAVNLFARLGSYQAPETRRAGDLDCARRLNQEGGMLELCLFPGKHALRVRYLARAARILGISGSS